MKKEHLELKVGIVTFLALVLSAALLIVVEDRNILQKTYLVKVGFDDAKLLMEGSAVHLSGVKVGRVDGVFINPKLTAGKQVIVQLEIQDGFSIPKGSTFSIVSFGFFGTNYVGITPPEDLDLENVGYIEKNSVVIFQGTNPASFQDLIARGKSVRGRLEDILDNVNEVVGDSETKSGLRQIVKNMESSTSKLDSIMGTLKSDFTAVSEDVLKITSNLQGILVANRSRIDSSLENVEGFTEQIEQIAAENRSKIHSVVLRIDQITADIHDDGQLKQSLQKIRDNFVKVSENVKSLTLRANEIVQNPALEEKIHSAIDSAKNAANALTEIKEDIYSTETSFSSQVLYSGRNSHFQSNFHVDTQFKDKYFMKLGVEDTSVDSDISIVQGGIKQNGTLYRAGLLKDKFGVGIERKIGNVEVGLESYDINDPKHRAFTKIPVNESTSVMMKLDRMNKNNRDVLVGVSHKF